VKIVPGKGRTSLGKAQTARLKGLNTPAKQTTKADARANAKALKSAKGPSLAPKGYKPDTEGRAQVNSIAKQEMQGRWSKVAGMRFPGESRKTAYQRGAKETSSLKAQKK
jgi:hypothetical protein